MSGIFITFEGIDGVGKTTQCKLLYNYLTDKKYSCTLTREPGGTEGAELIRNFIFNAKANSYSTLAEILLFSAARVDHVEKLIKPKLDNNEVIICDRFTDSTFAYQKSSEVSDEFLVSINQLATMGCSPDITFLLDLPPEIALDRLKNRQGELNKYDAQDLTSYENSYTMRRDRYLQLAKKYPQRIYIVDASEEIDTISNNIISIFNNWLKTHK